MRRADPADFGLKELDAVWFDYGTMTVSGCKCPECRDWKTRAENRRFWRVKAAPNPLIVSENG